MRRCAATMALRRQGACRAFTLLEVLISLGLIAALLGALFAFYFNLLQSRERIAARAERARGAELMIENLERALMFCIAGDAKFGSGIDGSNERVSILSRGVLPTLDDGEGNAALLDLQRIEIATRANGPATMRREAVSLGGSQPASGGSTTTNATVDTGVLADALGMVRLRYHDGSAWRDSFNAMSAGGLPRAIEVAIWFDDPRPPDDDVLLDADDEDTDPEEAGFLDPLADEGLAGTDDEDEWPLPDRHRIIVIPDAEEPADVTTDDQGGGA